MTPKQEALINHIRSVAPARFKMERPSTIVPDMIDLTWSRNGDMMSVLIAEDGDAWWWFFPHVKSTRMEFKEVVRFDNEPSIPIKVKARLSEMFEEEVVV